VITINRIRSLHRRAKNIVVDWCRKFAKEVIVEARKHRYAIALEELIHLRENMVRNGGKAVWKLTMFAYRKLQESIVSKTVEYDIPIVFVNPRSTSSICPRCGARLAYNHRLAVCKKCGFIADRDIVGAMNIWLRVLYAYAGEHGSLQSAPAVKDETRQSGRTKNKGMKKVIRSIQK